MLLDILDNIAKICSEKFSDMFDWIVCFMPINTYIALKQELSTLLPDTVSVIEKSDTKSDCVTFQLHGIGVTAYKDECLLSTRICMYSKKLEGTINYPYKYHGLSHPAFIKRR